jgi:hypothetical protein
VTRNHTFDYMVKHGIPKTTDHYTSLNYCGDKTVADLDGEELAEILGLVEEGLLSVITSGSEMIQ